MCYRTGLEKRMADAKAASDLTREKTIEELTAILDRLDNGADRAIVRERIWALRERLDLRLNFVAKVNG